MTHGPGHNRGPAPEGGRGWRRHAWRTARRELLPHMPLEVVRRRVTRARELGLTYPAYATIRAASGRDIVGFLFSANALGLRRPADAMPREVTARLSEIVRCERVGLLRAIPANAPLERVAVPPLPHDGWRQQRTRLSAACAGLPSDAVVLIGDAPWERGWTGAGRLAGYLPAGRFFAPS